MAAFLSFFRGVALRPLERLTTARSPENGSLALTNAFVLIDDALQIIATELPGHLAVTYILQTLVLRFFGVAFLDGRGHAFLKQAGANRIHIARTCNAFLHQCTFFAGLSQHPCRGEDQSATQDELPQLGAKPLAGYR